MRPVRKSDNLTTSLSRCHEIRDLNFLEPSGPLQACNGTDLPLPLRQTYQFFIIKLRYMFRPLWGHRQAFHLNHVYKTLRTLLGSHFMLQDIRRHHVWKIAIAGFQTWCHVLSDNIKWDPNNVRSVLMMWFKWKAWWWIHKGRNM